MRTAALLQNQQNTRDGELKMLERGVNRARDWPASREKKARKKTLRKMGMTCDNDTEAELNVGAVKDTTDRAGQRCWLGLGIPTETAHQRGMLKRRFGDARQGLEQSQHRSEQMSVWVGIGAAWRGATRARGKIESRDGRDHTRKKDCRVYNRTRTSPHTWPLSGVARGLPDEVSRGGPGCGMCCLML
jgi:hypothetical protein